MPARLFEQGFQCQDPAVLPIVRHVVGNDEPAHVRIEQNVDLGAACAAVEGPLHAFDRILASIRPDRTKLANIV